jgi:hypothetical protein
MTENTSAGLEARVGFEPTNGGFADLSLRPLGYRAEVQKYNETGEELSVAGETPGIPQRETTGITCASRIKRADSSGGVGQI